MKDSKDIEYYVIQLLSGVAETDLIIDEYTISAIKIYRQIKDLINCDYSTPYKPKIKVKPVYSKKSGEPKTDIVLPCSNFTFKFTIKKDDGAYIVSCNSPEDFITQFIDIHNGRDILDKDMIEMLEKCASYIRKVSNFYSYDKTYKKDNNIEGFVRDKFKPRALKYANLEKVEIYSNYIIECYNNPNKQSEYILYLHEAESYLQNVIRILFEKYPDYSKKIIFELLTGNIKFNNSLCSANYLVSNDGIFILDNYNCEYVNIIFNKFINSPKIARLQNVPRKYVTKRTLLTNNLELIANDFSVADLTFKI